MHKHIGEPKPFVVEARAHTTDSSVSFVGWLSTTIFRVPVRKELIHVVWVFMAEDSAKRIAMFFHSYAINYRVYQK